jgi:hypothetical protein
MAKPQHASSRRTKTGRRSKPATPRHERAALGSETPTAEAATVGWMLALFATLSAELLGMLTRWLAFQQIAPEPLRVLSGTLLLVAVFAGLVTLVLTPVTLKLRRVPPPTPILALALVSAIVPLVTVLILVFR